MFVWAFLVVAVGLSLGALVFGGWTDYPKTFSQFRNPILILSFLAALGRLCFPDFVCRLAETCDPVLLRRLLLAVFAVAFLKASALDYAALALNALDASMYDYAMMNTLRGRFMESVIGRNHFGIHATPILFLFMPFHALFHSPLFTIFLHPIGLFFGAWLFDRCMATRKIEAWVRLGLLFAYLNSIWISRTLHYGFHVEIFYPVAFFMIDLWVHRPRSRFANVAFWLSALFFLSIKEDAPLHLMALGAAYFFVGKMKPGRLVFLIGVSACVLFLDLKIIVPMNSPTGRYELVSAVSAAGGTPREAIRTLFAHPVHFLSRYFTGEWWITLFPSLLLVLASPFFWIASLPLLGLYSLAGGSQMFSLTLYYGIPLVGPFFLGLVEGYVRVPVWGRKVGLGAALIGISMFGSGYLLFRRADLASWRALHADLNQIPAEAKICALGIFVPQLPYGKVRLIDLECLKDADYAVFAAAGTSISRYPLSPGEEMQIRKELAGWTPVPGASSEIGIFRSKIRD